MYFLPNDSKIYFTKNDPQDPRVGEIIKFCEIKNIADHSIAICSYPDDEGIRLNGGRPGAALAPQTILKYFFKMTLPARGPFPSQISDLGSLEIQNKTLAEKHDLARQLTSQLHQKSCFVLSLGGGHDYGFADAASFVQTYINNKPLVINFDAHLDVRPTQNGCHSGTPFRRLIEEFKNHFEFWEIGLQTQCNSKYHLDWAQKNGAQVLFLDDLKNTSADLIWTQPEPLRPCWISLDLDVFSSKEAPGCSASYGQGLNIESFLPWLQFLTQNFAVKGIGFYEVSPSLDTDDRTSKLAALILHHALRFYSQKALTT